MESGWRINDVPYLVKHYQCIRKKFQKTDKCDSVKFGDNNLYQQKSFNTTITTASGQNMTFSVSEL